jgi:hypothetical protein
VAALSPGKRQLIDGKSKRETKEKVKNRGGEGRRRRIGDEKEEEEEESETRRKKKEKNPRGGGGGGGGGGEEEGEILQEKPSSRHGVPNHEKTGTPLRKCLEMLSK